MICIEIIVGEFLLTPFQLYSRFVQTVGLQVKSFKERGNRLNGFFNSFKVLGIVLLKTVEVSRYIPAIFFKLLVVIYI